jgi:serine/threonine protein kinase
MSIFIFLVESNTIQTNLTHFSTNDSTGSSEDVKYNENNPSSTMNSETVVTSMKTCAILIYGNVVIASINLCGNKTPNCPYLANGGSFTAWIDITLEQILQVWLISGSYLQEQRPIKPLIEYPNFTLPIGKANNVSLFFRKSSCTNQIKAYETSTWNFNILNATQEAIPFSKKDTNWNKPYIGGSAVGGMVATFLIIGLLSLCLTKHHSRRAIKDCLGRSVFSFKELCIATKNFNKKQLLGRGRFRTVYKGCLECYDNILVAVKRINYDSKYAHKTFRAEISCLTKIQQENVVELLGWCHEKGRMLLVYEYMSNGSLYEWLHDNCKCKPLLPWKLRLNILEGIATAIEYLHTKCPLCLLHRNIKSSNIMLDANFVAHLGDFGLAHLLDHQKQYKTTIASGYLEYMAPELPYTGKATKESDVYSFGILVLEVICGRHPLDKKAVEPEDLVLLYSCWQAHQSGTLLNMVDPRLFQTSQPSRLDPTYSNASNEVIKNDVEPNKMILKNLLHLGLLCCLSNPKARPTIEMVIQVLQQIGYIDNVDNTITNVSMPSLPNTKLLGLYYSLEVLQARTCN